MLGKFASNTNFAVFWKTRDLISLFIEDEKNSIPQKNPSGDKINNS